MPAAKPPRKPNAAIREPRAARMLGHLPTCGQRLGDGNAVGVFEVPAHRKPTRNARDGKPVRSKLTLDIQRRRFPLETRICSNDHLANPTLRHTVHQSIDREILGSDAVQRRKSASENVIQAPELTGTL